MTEPIQPRLYACVDCNTDAWSSPGAPERELLPRRGTTFSLKGLGGYSIEFKRDASGKFTEAAFYTPDTVLIIKRK